MTDVTTFKKMPGNEWMNGYTKLWKNSQFAEIYEAVNFISFKVIILLV